ncbi:MAG: DUF6352 family protein [Caldimonas sp.]
MPDLRQAGGARWLVPTDSFLRSFLSLPELAVVAESCRAERHLHETLHAAPGRIVAERELAQLADADARSNYALFLAFRDALVGAGTLESYYLALVQSGRIAVPPLFIDRVVEAIVGHMEPDLGSAFERRAAELLFRVQRVAFVDGQVLCGDRATVDRLSDTAGFGDIGRLLREGQAPLRGAGLEVLSASNASAYAGAGGRRSFLLDMTHEVANDLGHGLTFTMTRANSGLRALARVLERWTMHFLDVATTITPLPRIDDAAWAWHIGLDVDSTALLNDLWRGGSLEAERLKRLIGLFRLEFANPDEMRTDLAGKPVYLGLAMSDEQTLKLKPQNLLLNLPLAAAM